jgi:hypothetical protein
VIELTAGLAQVYHAQDVLMTSEIEGVFDMVLDATGRFDRGVLVESDAGGRSTSHEPRPAG